MADITMLLQQMKLAASLATKGEWSFARSGFNSIVQASVTLLRGGPARVVLCKLFRSEWRSELNTAHDAAFIALANPTNVMTLVGELENAQRQIQAHERAEFTWLNALELPDDASRIDILPAIHAGKYALRDATKRIAELESQQPDLYLCRVKGDEELYSPCGKDYPRGRGYYVRPPSRTFTVKLPSLKQTESGERYVWSDGVFNYRSDVIEILRAAGIQVIEGEGQ